MRAIVFDPDTPRDFTFADVPAPVPARKVALTS